MTLTFLRLRFVFTSWSRKCLAQLARLEKLSGEQEQDTQNSGDLEALKGVDFEVHGGECLHRRQRAHRRKRIHGKERVQLCRVERVLSVVRE